MKVYYMIDPELGWDNVCAMGFSLKEMAQDYWEDEDLSELTNKEIESKIDESHLTYSSRTIN